MEKRTVIILCASLVLIVAVAFLHPDVQPVEGFDQTTVHDLLLKMCAPHTYPDLENLNSVLEVTRVSRPFASTQVYQTFFSDDSIPLFVHTIHGRSRLTARISEKNPMSRYFVSGAAFDAKIPASLKRMLHLAHVSYSGLMKRVFVRISVVGQEIHAEVRSKFDHNTLYALLQRLLVIEVVDQNAALMKRLDSSATIVNSLRAQVDAEKRNTGVAKKSAETLATEIQTLQRQLVASNAARARMNRKAIPEGLAVKCGKADTTVYRYTGGQLRHYPNPTIASSWDREWGSPKIVDCAGIPHGPPMSERKKRQSFLAKRAAGLKNIIRLKGLKNFVRKRR